MEIDLTKSAERLDRSLMCFKMCHKIFRREPILFTELSAPGWLTGADVVPGSTTDNGAFWNNHVLTLDTGQSVETDFQVITGMS